MRCSRLSVDTAYCLPRCVFGGSRQVTSKCVTRRGRPTPHTSGRTVCGMMSPGSSVNAQFHNSIRSSRNGGRDTSADQDVGSFLGAVAQQRLSRRFPTLSRVRSVHSVALVPGTLAFDLPVWDGLRFLGQVTAASHFGWPPRPSASSVPTMAWLRVSDAARSPIISAGSTLASPVPLRLSQFSSVASGPAIPALRLVVFAVSGALPHGSSGTAVWPYESLAETAPIGGLVAKVRPPDRREPSHHHWMGQQEVRQ